MFLLACCSVLAVLYDHRERPFSDSPLFWGVLFFFAATGLSILMSEDVGRSGRLSIPLLPAGLLFFILVGHFDGVRHIRLLYLTFSLVAIGLSCLLLWTAWETNEIAPSVWVTTLGSPLLIVPNDVTFFAIVAPFSFILLYREPRSMVGACSVLSLFLSLGVVCLLLSRVAMLTIIVSLVSVSVLIRPRLGLVGTLVLVGLIVSIDSIFGFRLLSKFALMYETRIALWVAAWKMFCEKPFVGHGPHMFPHFYQSYLERVELPNWAPLDDRSVSWAHNLYLETLAEQGLLGAFALGFLLVKGISIGRSLQRAPPRDEQLFGAAALAGLYGFCLAAMVELSLVRQWVAIILFVCLGVLAHLSSANWKNQT